MTTSEALARVERLREGCIRSAASHREDYEVEKHGGCLLAAAVDDEDAAALTLLLAEAHRAHRLREACEAVKPFVEAWAKASHLMDGFSIGADGLPCALAKVETPEDRLLARLTAVLETPDDP